MYEPAGTDPQGRKIGGTRGEHGKTPVLFTPKGELDALKIPSLGADRWPPPQRPGLPAHSTPYAHGMKKFNVLVVHCAYQLQGGEDLVVDAEVALMREMGHDVRVYLRRNDDIQHMPVWQVARDTIWLSLIHI